MQKDLGLSDKMWSLGISAYYIGYIISQLPATIWIAKGLPRYQIPCYVIAWSSVTACMAAMKAGWAFVLCRFLVGFAEGPFLPIVSLITSSWYTKEEAPLRMAIWHAGNIGSSCVSGLLAGGIQLGMEGTLGIRGWKWFLIIEGKCIEAEIGTSYLISLEKVVSVCWSASLASGEFPTTRTTTARHISVLRWPRWLNIV